MNIPSSIASMACIFLLTSALSFQVSALTVDVQPNVISNDFRGILAISITGLAPGEEVTLDRYADFDQDGTVGPSDRLLQSLPLKDGFAPLIGEVRNPVRPADLDSLANGEITVRLPHFLQPEGCLGIGHYLFRATPKTSTPAAVSLQIRPPADAQLFRGQVTANNIGVTGALVFLLPHVDASPVAYSYTDAKGNYTLPAPPGAYLVGAVHPDYLCNLDSSSLIPLNAGEQNPLNISLQSATDWIWATVQDHDTKDGIPGLQLFLNANPGGISLLITDGRGRFRIPKLSSGSNVEIQSNPLAAQILGYATEDRSRFVQATSGEMELVLELFKGTGLLQGRFTQPGGAPIPYLKIEAARGSYLANTLTDGEGNYSMVLPEGYWRISPDPDEPVNFIGNSANPSLSAGQVAQANIELRQAIHLRGRATTSTGEPLTNAYIRGVSADTSQFRSEQRTSEDGSFDIPVYEGEWYLQLSRHLEPETNYVFVTMTVDVKAGQDIDNIAFITPLPTSRIICKVQDRLGNPVSGIQVWGWMSGENVSYSDYLSTTTDENGVVPLPAIAGTWYVRLNNATSLGYKWMNQKEVAVADRDVELLFIVSKASNLSITTTSLPKGMEMQPYDAQLLATGGAPPYTWSLVYTNGLPRGLVLERDGRLHGIPLSAAYSFHVSVSDSQGGGEEAVVSLPISAAPRIENFKVIANDRVMFLAAKLENRAYLIELSTDLKQWVAITAPTNSGYSTWHYQFRSASHCFYRIALVGE